MNRLGKMVVAALGLGVFAEGGEVLGGEEGVGGCVLGEEVSGEGDLVYFGGAVDDAELEGFEDHGAEGHFVGCAE